MTEQSNKQRYCGKWMPALLALVLTGCPESPKVNMAYASRIGEPERAPQNPLPPEILLAEEVAVPDNAAVIGVSSGDYCRAYLVDAFTESDSCQVVNDLLGPFPVTVTYCTRSKYCRVLTSRGSDLLSVSVAGHSDRGLELSVGGRRYAQSDPQLPLEDCSFQTTTWRDWKSQHPNTDIYLGQLDEG
jgi:hypothetical protein